MKHLTGVRNADDIIATADGGDAVLLDGRGDLVTTQLNVASHGWVELGVLKGHDGDDTDRTLLLKLDLGDATPGSQYSINEDMPGWMMSLTERSQDRKARQYAGRGGRRSQPRARGTQDRCHPPRHPSGTHERCRRTRPRGRRTPRSCT